MTPLLRNSPIPLNHQLSRQLEAQIVQSQWQVGCQIPSVRQLTASYGVSMPVVRQALQMLVKQGVIETHHGKGSFVRKCPQPRMAVTTRTLMFMLVEPTSLKMNYFLRLYLELEKAAVSHGLNVELCQFEPDHAGSITSIKPYGVIWCGSGHTHDIEHLLDHHVPVVTVGDGADIERVPRIVSDDFCGGYQAGRHLFESGHRNVCVLSRSMMTGYTRRRLAGFRHAAESMRHVSMKVLSCEGRDVAQVLEPVLDSCKRPTAVFAATDRLAYAVMQLAEDMGLSVPGELSVMGYGDEPFAESLTPGLTTIRIDMAAMARACVGAVCDMRKQNGPQSVSVAKLPVQLIERRSVSSL